MSTWNNQIGITSWPNRTNQGKELQKIYTTFSNDSNYIGLTPGNQIPLPAFYSNFQALNLTAETINNSYFNGSNIQATNIDTTNFFANSAQANDLSANNVLTNNVLFRDIANSNIDTLNVVNGSLYLNGNNILISTISTSVLDWSKYPAISNVDINNKNINNIKIIKNNKFNILIN